MKIFKVIKLVILLILALVLTLIIILASAFSEFKTASVNAFSAKSNLETVAAAVTQKNWTLASEKLEQANTDLDLALISLNKIQQKKAFYYIKPLSSQIADLEYLLQSVDIVAQSFSRILPLVSELSTLSSHNYGQTFANLEDEQKNRFFQLIYESEPELQGLKANLELAQINLEKIKQRGILWPIYSEIIDIKKDLSQVTDLLDKMTPLTKLLPALLGYPSQSDYLLIMHNNDELRPSGGFIGVFGLLSIHQAEILKLETYDSYHLDMPAVGKWQLEPPAPIKKYMQVQNWYLRDANWSPDWPSSARQIQDIYYGESVAIGQSAPNFTGVFGITPKFVSDLLSLVGPIEIQGVTYTPDNLQPLLQYAVEVAYLEQDISQWDRKAVINELLAELKNRLLTLETQSLPTLLTIISNNIETKDLQLYFNNSNWQSLAMDIGADGAVDNSDSDYLLVVDANMAAFKSDAVVQKNIDYKLDKDKAFLNLSYRHDGGFDWRTTRYRSYTRVYVPLGSKLIDIRALNQANLDADSINSFDDLSLNKTVFGFFFSVEPGTQGNIELNYRLPENVQNQVGTKDYYLLVQNQAGRRTNNLKLQIEEQIFNRYLNKDLIIKPYAN